MKRNLNLLAALFLCGLFLGCASVEKTAYVTVGTITTTVDAAMNAWGDYVRAGLADPQSELRVKAAYQSYQQAMQVAKVTVLAFKANEQTADGVRKSVEIASAAGDALLDAIISLLPPDRAAKLRRI